MNTVAVPALVEFLLARIGEDETAARATVTPFTPQDGPTWTAAPHYRLEKNCRCLSCWEPVEGWWDLEEVQGSTCPTHGCDDLNLTREQAEHMARWNPHRVLIDCQARRLIVTTGGSECSDYAAPGSEDRAEREDVARQIGMDYQPHWPEQYAPFCDGCAAAQSADHDWTRTLRLLALGYVDHPDYDPTWRP